MMNWLLSIKRHIAHDTNNSASPEGVHNLHTQIHSTSDVTSGVTPRSQLYTNNTRDCHPLTLQPSCPELKTNNNPHRANVRQRKSMTPKRILSPLNPFIFIKRLSTSHPPASLPELITHNKSRQTHHEDNHINAQALAISSPINDSDRAHRQSETYSRITTTTPKCDKTPSNSQHETPYKAIQHISQSSSSKTFDPLDKYTPFPSFPSFSSSPTPESPTSTLAYSPTAAPSKSASSRLRRAGTIASMNNRLPCPSSLRTKSDDYHEISNYSFIGSSIDNPSTTFVYYNNNNDNSNNDSIDNQSIFDQIVSESPPVDRIKPEVGLGAGPQTAIKRSNVIKRETDDNELRSAPPRDDWDIVLDRIREYRATHTAPVDTVGCEALTVEEKDPKKQRFRSLISLMLSAQTKDEITAEAVRNLSQRLPGGLTPKSLSEAQIDLIRDCVRRVGFWQRKSGYIKEAARTCLEQYDGDIPRTVPQLLSLPGVGPKMAYLAMHAAWQDNQGIGVDTHVLRISHKLGWVSKSSKTPEATRHSLESWLPKSLWREINPLLVGFGQTVCKAVKPMCDECPVSQYCPSAQLRPAGDKNKKGTRARRATNQKNKDSGVSSDPSHDDGHTSGALSSSTESQNERSKNELSVITRRLGGATNEALTEVDVEDLANIVRGAELAVRSRNRSNSGSKSKSKNSSCAKPKPTRRAFPLIPKSPAANGVFFKQEEDGNNESIIDNTVSNSLDLESQTLTESTSRYFMRSRSNAASEQVRPEAKTDSVLKARAQARAKRLYSRRLSKSDMQWALGEEWDPDDDSSLSSLSDFEADDLPGEDSDDTDSKSIKKEDFTQ